MDYGFSQIRIFMEETDNDRTYEIIGAAMEVHRHLGMGFSEYIYQDALAREFDLRKIPYEKEKQMKVTYKGEELAHYYFADFVCYGEVIVETKAVSALNDEHRFQVLNYMRATGHKLALLINFGERSLRYRRMINSELDCDYKFNLRESV